MRVVRLEGDAPNATISSIRLGGQTPDASGALQPLNQTYTLLSGTPGSSSSGSSSSSSGAVPWGYIRFTVDVPPVSAALLLCESVDQRGAVRSLQAQGQRRGRLSVSDMQ
jgi:hypothetical protein